MNSNKSILNKYINETINKNELNEITFKNVEKFNFAIDIIDKLAEIAPEQMAMLYIDENKYEKIITYRELKIYSNKVANFFLNKGIKRGDTILIALQRSYQFWYIFLGLTKIGAIPIPMVSQLRAADIKERIELSKAKAIISIFDTDFQKETDKVLKKHIDYNLLKFSIRGGNSEWIDVDKENLNFSEDFIYCKDYNATDDMFMLFTSGTSGKPKMIVHNNLYPLTHYITGKYWNHIEQNKLHFTISDTGWGKALWGKLFGPWLAGGCVFVYDFKKFKADEILHMIEMYQINTVCMPPTMYRMLLQAETNNYDLSSVKYACSAGEVLSKDIVEQFGKQTGIKIANGYGQSETGLLIADFKEKECRPGSMGYPNPIYEIELMNENGEIVRSEEIGTEGEIVINCQKQIPIGVISWSATNSNVISNHIINGYYHTNDLAYRDELGAYWYVGRNDTIIKSSGYKINPYEIECVLANLNYIKECRVYGVEDRIRGTIIKADIILSKEKMGTEELKKEIQDFVKSMTAPYKYPRKIEFVNKIEKTISGKIARK